jgi:hypothetical protein
MIRQNETREIFKTCTKISDQVEDGKGTGGTKSHNMLKDLILGHDDNDDDSDNYDMTMMSTVMIKMMFIKQ